MREVFLVILCVLLYGSATFFKRLGLAQLHPYQFLLIAGFFYFICSPLWLWLLSQQTTASPYTKEGIFLVAIYAFFSIAAGLIVAFLLRNTNNPGALIVMVNLSSLVTLLLSYFFLNEQLSNTKIIAVLLGVLSLVLMNC